jgi:1-acyl-sn-glycerol-3-phosphate acyltransferase
MMIYPKHQWWAHTIFRLFVRRLCRRRFHALHLVGDIPDVPNNVPILLLPNHSTWWDGFFLYVLNNVLFQRTFHVMMLEHRLREFWFFRFIGAFSINQQSPKGIVETLDFTARLLQSLASDARNDAAPFVIVFPQGELRPHWIRPLGYNRGVERIVRKFLQQQPQYPLAVIPIAIRCEMLDDELPHVFMECGAVRMIVNGNNHDHQHDRHNALVLAGELEREEESLLATLEERIKSGERGRRIL